MAGWVDERIHSLARPSVRSHSLHGPCAEAPGISRSGPPIRRTLQGCQAWEGAMGSGPRAAIREARSERRRRRRDPACEVSPGARTLRRQRAESAHTPWDNPGGTAASRPCQFAASEGDRGHRRCGRSESFRHQIGNSTCVPLEFYGLCTTRAPPGYGNRSGSLENRRVTLL